MSVFTFSGVQELTSGDGKPRNVPNPSWVTIAALPEHRVVYQEKITGGSVSTDLMMGKYAMSVVGCYVGRRARRQVRCHYVIEFLHDCTEEQWEVLRDLGPKMADSIITSKGTVWTCRYCGKRSTSRVEAAVHECIHLGIDPLALNANEAMQEAIPVVPKGFVPVAPPSLNPLTPDAIPAPTPGPEPSVQDSPLTLEELPK